jgi:hypothetical protein
MGDRTDKRAQRARTELSAERLELIRRFMSDEPERNGKDVVPAQPPKADDLPLRGDTPQASAARDAASRPPAMPITAATAPPLEAAWRANPRTWHEGPTVLQALGASMRGHAEVGWLAAAIVLALVVALLIAHQA